MNKLLMILFGLVGVIIMTALVFVFLQNNEPDIITPTQTDSGIEVFSPKPNEIISSPLKITGQIKGNGWTGFEGQAGTVQLLDSEGNQLVVTYLPAVGEWMQLPVQFETNISFTVPGGSTGSLIFHNENASGDPEREKIFTVPIRFR